ncbi:MAG TPA: hypothetical protein VMO47_01180 [Rhodothermales bacterium]|nr:hypothetical protein [Rhodothermales bacterium]
METIPPVELESIQEIKDHLKGNGSLRGTVLQGLDLRDAAIEEVLIAQPLRDCYFLGCRFSSRLYDHIRSSGGTIFPIFRDLPFDPYRSSLYSVSELTEGYERGNPASMARTRDARIYRFFQTHRKAGRRTPILEALACRIHDHAIDNALRDLIDPPDSAERRIVGVMGGHKLRRTDPGFLNVARIARTMTREGYFIATGGGPGAMEAGNLGAWLADRSERQLVGAIDLLRPEPSYVDPHYLDRAFDVLDRFPTGRESLAVPTWFYGHEPSNLFSAHIAKYFANSIREDGLLAIATAGVVFSPGSAGTIQEIFQDAAQNHYGSMTVASPMVFLGVDYWSRFRPVYQLLMALAEGKAYRGLIHITDDPEGAVDFILKHPPIPAY